MQERLKADQVLKNDQQGATAPTISSRPAAAQHFAIHQPQGDSKSNVVILAAQHLPA